MIWKLDNKKQVTPKFWRDRSCIVEDETGYLEEVSHRRLSIGFVHQRDEWTWRYNGNGHVEIIPKIKQKIKDDVDERYAKWYRSTYCDPNHVEQPLDNEIFLSMMQSIFGGVRITQEGTDKPRVYTHTIRFYE